MKSTDNDRTEINAFVKDNKCDVLLSGTPDTLLSCISSIIRAFSIRLMEEEDVRAMQKEMDIPDDTLEAYLAAMIMGEIIESFDNISTVFSCFDFAGEGETLSMEDIKNKYCSTTFGDDNVDKPDIELDFGALSGSEEDSTNE